MLPVTEHTVRAVQRAIAEDDFTTALAIARAAYQASADEDTRAELLLWLGPRAASSPIDCL
ncbi:hypothetical protein ACWGH5_18260 [Streptomyces sp. NPDC054864]